MRWLGLSVCLMVAACGSDSTGGRKSAVGDEDDTSDEGDGKKVDAGKKQDAGKNTKTDAGRDAGSGKTDAKTPATSQLVVPANVCKVLQDNACLTCHRTPLENGAPIPLFDVDHFTATAEDGTVADQVMVRIEDKQRPMPPISSGRPMLTGDDLETLKGWISGGMKGTTGTPCDPFKEPDQTVDLGVPDWAQQPWPEGECEAVFTLGAHGDTNPLSASSSAYDIPAAKTDYHCFYEKVPWPKEMHAIGLRVRRESADDMEFVHHLVVSAQNPLLDNSLAGAKPSFNGDHKHCDNPTGSTLAVWAPGSQNPITTPVDTTILLPNSDAWFELQVHYNNPQGKWGRQSKVRYDICATSKPRANTAGTFWLGYENAGPQTISGLEAALPLDNKGNGKAKGVCEAKNKGRILSIMPHMHELGKHAKVELFRKSGEIITLIDTPFDFEDQYSKFFKEIWVEQGDKVVTTCEWSKSPVNFGFASDQEMCFFYTLAYPLSTFAPGFGERGIVGGNLACAAGIGPN